MRFDRKTSQRFELAVEFKGGEEGYASRASKSSTNETYCV